MRDIADVVVAAVTGGDRYVGQAITVSGPRLLTFGEAGGEVEFLVELFESLLDGRNSYLSEGVREVLGREARDFSEFVREAAAADVWKVGS